MRIMTMSMVCNDFDDDDADGAFDDKVSLEWLESGCTGNFLKVR